MTRTDEQYAIMAASENLDVGLEQLKKSIQAMDLSLDERFNLLLSFNMIKGVASYMRAKKNQIAETQP